MRMAWRAQFLQSGWRLLAQRLRALGKPPIQQALLTAQKAIFDQETTDPRTGVASFDWLAARVRAGSGRVAAGNDLSAVVEERGPSLLGLKEAQSRNPAGVRLTGDGSRSPGPAVLASPVVVRGSARTHFRVDAVAHPRLPTSVRPSALGHWATCAATRGQALRITPLGLSAARREDGHHQHPTEPHVTTPSTALLGCP